MKQLPPIFWLLLVTFMSCSPASAAQRIAVLDFELNDITSLPNTPAELRRTAMMAPLLSEALGRVDGYEIVAIDAAMVRSANAGFGYLFRFHDLAAQLGRRLGVDWIVVAQHSKPSFLYSYLRAHLIDAKQGTLIASFDIELKGNHDKVTRRGIASLAEKIRDTINRKTL